MKPHRVRKLFQAAAGHSIKIITIYIQHTAIQVTPSTLLLNKLLVQSTITYDRFEISVRTNLYPLKERNLCP